MLYLYKSLLFFSILGFSLCAMGMEPEQKDDPSVARNLIVARAAGHTSPSREAMPLSVEETPGKLLSQRQAEVFKKEKFEEVLGIDEVKELDIKWEELANVNTPFNASEKLSSISRLVTGMQRLARGRTDAPFRELRGMVLEEKAAIEDVHLERLEGAVQVYFKRLFPGYRIDHKMKTGGVQLGTIVEVRLPEGKIIKFYVKTHSEGKLASKSSAAKVVNPRELLVYKALEALNIGCETHFCGRNPEDIYIATRDAEEGGSFFLFKKAKEDPDGLGRNLWGTLGDLSGPIEHYDLQAIEQNLKADLVGRHFVLQIATLDVLSRIFRMHDLLDNTENFGFFRQAPETPFLSRIIDFRIHGNEEKFHLDEGRFGGFLEGNCIFNHGAAHKTIGYILRHREVKKRAETALYVLRDGPLKSIRDTIEQAYTDVQDFLRSDIFKDARIELTRDLTTYRDILVQNVAFFSNRLDAFLRE